MRCDGTKLKINEGRAVRQTEISEKANGRATTTIFCMIIDFLAVADMQTVGGMKIASFILKRNQLDKSSLQFLKVAGKKKVQEYSTIMKLISAMI